MRIDKNKGSFEEIVIKTPDGNVKLGELAQVESKSANMFMIDMVNSPEYVKNVFQARKTFT